MTLFPHVGIGCLPGSADEVGVWHFRISASSRAFEGHFDGAPILPGVTHVAIALAACAERAPLPGSLRGLRDIRFSRPLLPGDDVDVVLDDGRESGSVRFEIRSDGQTATSGLLLFAANDDAGT